MQGPCFKINPVATAPGSVFVLANVQRWWVDEYGTGSGSDRTVLSFEVV